jgi:hypothetical protein
MEVPTIQLILIVITGLVVAGIGTFGPSMAHYGRLHRANLQAAAKYGGKIGGQTLPESLAIFGARWALRRASANRHTSSTLIF